MPLLNRKKEQHTHLEAVRVESDVQVASGGRLVVDGESEEAAVVIIPRVLVPGVVARSVRQLK